MDRKMPDFSLKKWEGIVNGFYEKYSGLKKWHDSLVQGVVKNGGIHVNPSNRFFKFTMFRNKRGMLEYSRPQILNYPVQSFASAEIIPLAMVAADTEIKRQGLRAVMCNQIHDDIMYDCHEDDKMKVGKILLDTMTNLPYTIEYRLGVKFNVPLSGEVKMGTDWGSMKEVPNDILQKVELY